MHQADAPQFLAITAQILVWGGVPSMGALNAKQEDPSGFRERAGGIAGVTRRQI